MKKVLSLLLSVVLLFSVFSTTTFAADAVPSGADSVRQETALSAEGETSGNLNQVQNAVDSPESDSKEPQTAPEISEEAGEKSAAPEEGILQESEVVSEETTAEEETASEDETAAVVEETETAAAKDGDTAQQAKISAKAKKAAKLGASSGNNYYYYPDNVGKKDGEIIILPAGTTNGNGSSDQNAQLRLENAINKASETGADIRFMNYFRKFTEGGLEDKDTTSISYDGQGLTMLVDDVNYQGHLFQIEKNKTYTLSNMKFAVAQTSSGAKAGEINIRMIGGTALLDNVSAEGTILFELSNYNLNSADLPLTIINAPSGSVYTIEVDSSTATAAFQDMKTDIIKLADVSGAGDCTYAISAAQGKYFDLEVKDGTLYLKAKFIYTAGEGKKYVFLSQAEGDDANSGETHFTAVKTMAKAVEIYNSSDEYAAIVLKDNTPYKVTGTEVWDDSSADRDILYRHWDGKYEDSKGTMTGITMSPTSLLSVESAGVLTLGKSTSDYHFVLEGDGTSAVSAAGGTAELNNCTIQNTTVSSGNGGAINASAGAKVSLNGVTLGKNYASTGSQIYAAGTNTTVTLDEDTVIGDPGRAVTSIIYAESSAVVTINTNKWTVPANNCTYYNYVASGATLNLKATLDKFNDASKRVTYLIYAYAGGSKVNMNEFNVLNSNIGTIFYSYDNVVVNVEKCRFDDNNIRSGAFNFGGSSMSGTMKFKDTEFIGNTSESSSGYLIYGSYSWGYQWIVELDGLTVKNNQNADIIIGQGFDAHVSGLIYEDNGKDATGTAYSWSKARIAFTPNCYTDIKAPSVADSIIKNNIATIGNAGIDFSFSGYSKNYTPTLVSLSGVEVSGNTAANGFAGMHLHKNSDNGDYGVKYLVYEVDGCTVADNTGSTGAGLWYSGTYKYNSNTNYDSKPMPLPLSNTVISGNKGGTWQGIYNDNCYVVYGEGNVVDYASEQAIYQTMVSAPVILSSEISGGEGKKVIIDLGGIDDDTVAFGKSIAEPANPKYASSGLTDVSALEDKFEYRNITEGYTAMGDNKRIVYGESAIFLDGAAGNDSNTGLSYKQPKKTFAGAKSALMAQLESNPDFPKVIYITDTVEITGAENWDGKIGDANVVIKRYPSFTEDLVQVTGTGGSLSAANLTFEGTAAEEVFENSGNKLNGGAITVKGGTLTSTGCLTFTDEPAYELKVVSGTVNLVGAKFKDCKSGFVDNIDGKYNNQYQEAPIYIKDGNVTLKSCEISGTEKCKGSIHQEKGTLTLASCTIHDTTVYCSSAAGSTSNDTGTVLIEGSAEVNVKYSGIYNTRRVYTTGAASTDLSGIVCRNTGSTPAKLNIDDSIINYVDVQNTELQLGGLFALDNADTGYMEHPAIKLRYSGTGMPYPITLNKANAPYFGSSDLIYVSVESPYLGNVVVEGDEELKAENYYDNFVLDPACTTCGGFSKDETNHDIIANVKDVYLDGKKGDDSRNGSSPTTAVKTFEHAMEILKANGSPDNGGSNIIICGTVTINTDTEWSMLNDTDAGGKPCFTNEAGMTWQPKLMKIDNGFGGNMIEVAENASFTMKNIIFDGNKAYSDTWETDSDKAHACIKLFSSSNNGGKFKMDGCTVQNVFRRFLYINTPSSYGANYADESKYDISFNNTNFTGIGDTAALAEYIIYAKGIHKLAVTSCEFSTNYASSTYMQNSSFYNCDVTFKDTPFKESYGGLHLLNYTYYSYSDTLHRTVTVDNCDVTQAHEAEYGFEHPENTRFIKANAMTGFTVKNCDFNAGPRAAKYTTDYWINISVPYCEDATIDNCTFDGFSSPAKSSDNNIIRYTTSYYGARPKTDQDHQMLVISNSTFTNCYRSAGSNSGDALIYSYASGNSGEAYKKKMGVKIDSCTFEKGDEDNPYNSSPVVQGYYGDIELTGTTTIRGNKNNSGAIYAYYYGGSVDIGEKVLIEDCARVLYQRMGDTSYRTDRIHTNINGTIQNCATDDNNAILYLYASGLGYKPVVTFDGAKILNNKHTNSSTYGYGIIYCSGCDVEVEDSQIEGNQSSTYNGIIYLINSKLTLSDGAKINNNTLNAELSSSTTFRTIYLYDASSELVMNGGEIRNNYSNIDKGYTYGGAVYSSGATVTINGGLIEGNGCYTPYTYGGAFYLTGASTLNINGGTIRGNGVQEKYVTSDRGGAVYTESYSAAINIGGDAVLDGNCAYYGGGIYLYGGSLAMNGNAAIENCEAYYYGGGIYATSPKKLELGGNAKISGCECMYTDYSQGGGICYSSGSTALKVTDSFTLENCKAAYGGGIYLGNSIPFNMSFASKVTNNTASKQGGGLYLGAYGSDGSTDIDGARFEGGTISYNKAESGGAIYSSRALSLGGTTIENNTTTGSAAKTDDVYTKKYVYLLGNQSEINDTIFLPDRRYPVQLMQSCQGSNKYNLTVAATNADSETGYPYSKGMVAVDHGPELGAADAYLSYFTLSNGNFALVSGKGDNAKKIVLGVSCYVDGINGSDSNNGENPAQAFKTFEKAAEVMAGYEGTLYVCGTLSVEGTAAWKMKDGQTIKRYTGFEIMGVDYDAFTGDLVNVKNGGSLTLDSSIGMSSEGTVSGSFIKVDEGGTLVLNGAKLAGNDNGSSCGGAIINNGDVTIAGSTEITRCKADNGGAIYHKGTSLTLKDTPLIDAEIYIEKTEDEDKRIISVDDSSAAFSPKNIITVDMADGESERLVVSHSDQKASDTKFKLDAGIGTAYILVVDPTNQKNMVLADVKCIYVDGAKTASASDDGVTPATAFTTIKEAYKALQPTSGDDGLSYGMIVIVNPVSIDETMAISGTGYRDMDMEDTFNVGKVSFIRYSQPTAHDEFEGFDAADNTKEMFIVENDGILILSDVSLNGHSLAVDSPHPDLTADGVSNAGAIVKVKDGGKLGVSGNTILFENAGGGNGGALEVLKGGYAELIYSTIQDVSAKNGGAVYTDGTVKILTGEDAESNTFSRASAENGGAVYIAPNGSVTAGVNTYINANCSAENGSAVYVGGEFAVRDLQVISGSVYLAKDKFIEAPSATQNNGSIVIDVEDPYEHRVLVKGETNYMEDAMTIDYDLKKMFVKGLNESDNTIIELQARPGIYIDGVNGSDSADGLSPATAVKTLDAAYSKLKNYKACALYVVNTVTINSTTLLSDSKCLAAGEVKLAEPAQIIRYVKPSVTTGLTGFDVDSFKGPLFDVVSGGTLTLQSITIDGHSKAATVGGQAVISPAIDANAALINVSGGVLELGKELVLMNNKNAADEAASGSGNGGGVYETSGKTVFAGVKLSELEAVHGSGAYINGTAAWDKQSSIGTHELFLDDNETSELKGSFIDVNVDNPNGVDASGNANKIYIDMPSAAYSTGKRIIARYGSAAAFDDSTKEDYVLKANLPQKMEKTANIDKKYVWLEKGVLITETLLIDDEPAEGIEVSMMKANAAGTLVEREKATTDEFGQCIFNNGYLAGEYVLAFTYNGAECTSPIVVEDGVDLEHTSKFYTVTFNMNGHGTQVASQIIANGGKVVKPDESSAKGYNHNGWYKDQDCTDGKEWNFDTDTVTAPTTLYAKWMLKTTAITLDPVKGSGGTTSVTATWSKDMPAIETLPTPPSDDYKFFGYFDADGVQYYDKDGKSLLTWPDESTEATLYARYLKVSGLTLDFVYSPTLGEAAGTDGKNIEGTVYITGYTTTGADEEIKGKFTFDDATAAIVPTVDETAGGKAYPATFTITEKSSDGDYSGKTMDVSIDVTVSPKVVTVEWDDETCELT